MTRLGAVAAMFATVGIVAGCAERTPAPDSTQAPPAAPPTVDINAVDFAYQAPDTIPGGWVNLRLHNNGQELHHGALYRLDQGKTMADVVKLDRTAAPDWLVAVGGPSAPAPGGMLETIVQLAPGSYLLICDIPALGQGGVNTFQATLTAGDYAVICFIPDVKDGKPHAGHGMLKTITVL